MKTLIHIRISQYPIFSYDIPIVRWAKACFPQIHTYDFDSQSQSLMVDYAKEMIAQSQLLAIVIECEENAAPGPALKMMDILTRQKNKDILLIFNGQHAILEKMLTAIKGIQIGKNLTLPEQQKHLNDFFGSPQPKKEK
jgi:hypothetical protein